MMRSTTWPPLKRKTAGMELMPSCIATFWFLSVSTLPTLSLPPYSPARSSMIGPMARHGPHHTAQKSTSTGKSLARTSASKLASVKV